MATIDVKCRFYNQTDNVKKHGIQIVGITKDIEIFQINYTYRACKPVIKEQIVDLAMNNSGIRETVRALHISINAVVRALKNFLPVVCNSSIG